MFCFLYLQSGSRSVSEQKLCKQKQKNKIIFEVFIHTLLKIYDRFSPVQAMIATKMDHVCSQIAISIPTLLVFMKPQNC